MKTKFWQRAAIVAVLAAGSMTQVGCNRDVVDALYGGTLAFLKGTAEDSLSAIFPLADTITESQNGE